MSRLSLILRIACGQFMLSTLVRGMRSVPEPIGSDAPPLAAYTARRRKAQRSREAEVATLKYRPVASAAMHMTRLDALKMSDRTDISLTSFAIASYHQMPFEKSSIS